MVESERNAIQSRTSGAKCKAIKYDEDSLRRLALENQNDQKSYIFQARKELEQQEKYLEEDLKRGIVEYDKHWDSEQMRKALEKTQKR